MTVNKLTYPAKENAVQEKINEIIDNLGTSITVDQTYNGTSANPQSGVAIEGELSTNYQTKLVSGTNIKTINNTSLLGSGDIDTSEIFIATYGTTTYNSILNEYNAGKKIYCKNFDTTFDALIPLAIYYEDSLFEFIGFGSYTTTVYVFQCQKTNNTWTTSSTSLLSRSTIDTTINSSSTDSRVPSSKCVYNNLKNKADTTLSNVSSIDSNSAVQTALDGKVSKSGDTMTGNLAISEDATAKIELTNTSFDSTSTTAPTSNLYAGAIDIFGLDNHPVGHFRTRHSSANYFQSQMGVKRSINNTDYEANITVGISPDGTSACTFPNTKCVDGQWTTAYQDIISSDTSVNGSTNLTKRVAVPNDGYVYEAMIITRATTTSTSGQLLRVAIGTNQLDQDVLVCGLRTRTNNTMEVQATNIVPIKGVATNSTNLAIVRNSGTYGNINIMRLIAYRRVGTNA